MKRCLAFLERDARLALAAPAGLVMPFFSIAVTVAGFAFLSHLIDPHVRLDPGSHHADYLTYVVLNLAFMLLFNDTLNAVSGAVRRDQVAGTFEPIVAASTPVPIVIAGSSLWPLLIASVQVAAYIAIGGIFGVRLGHANLSALAVIVLLALACAGALGVLATAAVLRWRQAPPSTLHTIPRTRADGASAQQSCAPGLACLSRGAVGPGPRHRTSDALKCSRAREGITPARGLHQP